MQSSDIKNHILQTAGRVVNGSRREAYGTPEDNFERIANFWQAYFVNTGRCDVRIEADDVSPLMRLMKEARLCESPDHLDSFVDIVGYALTGAEVNGVTTDDGDSEGGGYEALLDAAFHPSELQGMRAAFVAEDGFEAEAGFEAENSDGSADTEEEKAIDAARRVLRSAGVTGTVVLIDI